MGTLHSYYKIILQSRILCVKCRVNRELSCGRKVITCGTESASRCYILETAHLHHFARIVLLHYVGIRYGICLIGRKTA